MIDKVSCPKCSALCKANTNYCTQCGARLRPGAPIRDLTEERSPDAGPVAKETQDRKRAEGLPETTSADAELAKQIRGRGVGMIALGVVHLLLSGLLDPIWGVVLVALGVLNLLFRKKGMFILNGLSLCVVGILNITSSFSTLFAGETPNLLGLWTMLGLAQIGWGIEEIQRFSKAGKPQEQPARTAMQPEQLPSRTGSSSDGGSTESSQAPSRSKQVGWEELGRELARLVLSMRGGTGRQRTHRGNGKLPESKGNPLSFLARRKLLVGYLLILVLAGFGLALWSRNSYIAWRQAPPLPPLPEGVPSHVSRLDESQDATALSIGKDAYLVGCDRTYQIKVFFPSETSVEGKWSGSNATFRVTAPYHAVMNAATWTESWNDEITTDLGENEASFSPWIGANLPVTRDHLHQWIEGTAAVDIRYPDEVLDLGLWFRFVNQSDHLEREVKFFVASPEELQMIEDHDAVASLNPSGPICLSSVTFGLLLGGGLVIILVQRHKSTRV